MAWISVHEKVIGGKLRRLAKEIGCSQNEALGLLVRLWLWGINNADKEGRIIGAEKEDVAEVLAVGIDARYSSDDVVDALVKTSWIDMDNGLYIHDWEEWQEQWYKAIETRQKNAERKRNERKRKRESSMLETPTTKKGMEEIITKAEPNNTQEEDGKMQNGTILYAKDFEEFWEEYPRKVGKGEAYKKYKARIKDGWTVKELIEAARRYAEECVRKHTEKEYIKHAKTFLSDSTPFVDYLPKENDIKTENETPRNETNPFADWR